jgi:hypothetical protein
MPMPSSLVVRLRARHLWWRCSNLRAAAPDFSELLRLLLQRRLVWAGRFWISLDNKKP